MTEKVRENAPFFVSLCDENIILVVLLLSR